MTHMDAARQRDWVVRITSHPHSPYGRRPLLGAEEPRLVIRIRGLARCRWRREHIQGDVPVSGVVSIGRDRPCSWRFGSILRRPSEFPRRGRSLRPECQRTAGQVMGEIRFFVDGGDLVFRSIIRRASRAGHRSCRRVAWSAGAAVARDGTCSRGSHFGHTQALSTIARLQSTRLWLPSSSGNACTRSPERARADQVTDHRQRDALSLTRSRTYCIHSLFSTELWKCITIRRRRSALVTEVVVGSTCRVRRKGFKRSAAAEKMSGIGQLRENRYEPAVLDPQDGAMTPETKP